MLASKRSKPPELGASCVIHRSPEVRPKTPVRPQLLVLLTKLIWEAGMETKPELDESLLPADPRVTAAAPPTDTFPVAWKYSTGFENRERSSQVRSDTKFAALETISALNAER